MENRRPTKKLTKGQSLIEILFAMSISIISVSTIAAILFPTQISARQAIERTKATTLASECIVAIRLIADDSFARLHTGSHGLVRSDTGWELSGVSDTSGKYTRTVTLSAIEQGIYEATCTIEWDIALGRVETLSQVIRLSNWQQTNGDAAHLHFSPEYAFFTATGTILTAITVENTHATDTLVLTDLLITWEGLPNLLNVSIDDTEVYTASTSGPISSGENLDITDVHIAAQEVLVPFGPLTFSADMQDASIHVAVRLSDGSYRYVHITP